ALGHYDGARPLVIDPELTWATFTQTVYLDDARAVATDAAGNVYVAASSLSNRGDFDVTLTKFDPSGKVVKSILLGGVDGDDHPYAIAVDSTGAVYLAGETTSSRWQISFTYAGLGGDGFYAKIDPTLSNYVYAGYFGGNGEDIFFGCALDANNNL